MWQLLKAMKRQLSIRRRQKSSRVADESAVGSLQALNQAHVDRSVSSLSVLLVIVRAPLAVASCLMGQTDGMEEAWASGEQPRTAEMDHLMVRDSMRYAIYV
ncbi:uncharacterized protein M6B38_360215 [Iris pallida]|uniref:Uncharacterized protein n=1 Tax=Iris pallida TaxID=29817 RepID=A0AAX6GLG2_IRIPA|nr:uncharacterized protein M6B38_360215 [Iris pallida]